MDDECYYYEQIPPLIRVRAAVQANLANELCSFFSSFFDDKNKLTKHGFLHILLAETIILSTVHTGQMDVEREEYHRGSSREEPPPAVSGSCKEDGKVRSGVRVSAPIKPR